ncbi:MAG: bifunctional folylpolyglutamate synthase/dihydrofolate synthase [Clostridia bacterium]|nr:bifunctional folylpolyglutamate synthase/dihydrofolate synthase [Clostridia bacterium]
MLYTSPEQYLAYLDTLGSHPGLEAIKELLNRIGSPHSLLKCIHIAGTNGKGSVAAYLTSIFIEANYQTGTFTSPEINDIRETICINRVPISLSDFDAYLKLLSIQCENMVKDGLRHPTRFEVLTALAFLYFKDKNCSIVILETGMGGRLDSTNVLTNPLCCAITALALDHTQFLGDTLEAIAYEKSGIIKSHSPVVLYPAEDTVREVFEKVCEETSSPLTIVDFDQLKQVSCNLHKQIFSYKHYLNVTISLIGEHQMKNAALALEVIEALKGQGITIDSSAIYKGFASAVWPGRFERISDHPLIFIDGAHNVQGARALSNTLSTYCKDKKITFIMGLLKDKDYKSISKLTAPLASRIFLVAPSNPRALDPKILEQEVKPYCPDTLVCTSVSHAVHLALENISDEDMIVAFGSLYFIGQIPAALKNTSI